MRTWIGGDERIVSAAPYRAPGLGQMVVQVVVQSDDASRAFVVDEELRVEPMDVFWAREHTARIARHGKMSLALFEQQLELAADDRVEVEIFVVTNLPEPQLPFDGTDTLVAIEEFEAWTRQHTNAQVARIAQAKARVLGVLAEHGAPILGNPRGLPTIRTRVPVALLTSAQLAADDVIEIDAVTQPHVELLGYAGHAAMGASPSSGGLSGGLCGGNCDGGLIDVGFWEADLFEPNPMGIARNNTRVSTGNTVTGYANCPKACASDADCPSEMGRQQRCRAPVAGQSTICVGDHITWEAASVGMAGGYAYDSNVPAGADPTPNVPAGTTFAAAGAWRVDHRVGNLLAVDGLDYLITPPCCGQMGCPACTACEFASAPPTPYVNRSASSAPLVLNFPGRAFGTFVTAGSGNEETGTSQCAQLRNGLCVGMFDYKTFSDQNTHERTDFGDGVVGSSFVNNTLVDPALERPHLLGPGNHSTVASGLHMPGIDVAPGGNQIRHAPHEIGSVSGIFGTSFAAPAVLSVAIQAHQYEGWFSPLAYPMVNKAVLLAATRDSNADGAVGKFNIWSQNAPTVDAEDGAGQINIAVLKGTLDNNRYMYRDMANSDFVSCGTNCFKYVVGSVTIPAQHRLRLVLAWQGCMTSKTSPFTLNDLDLALNCGSPVVACGGTMVSNTITSELEMLDRPTCPNNKTCTIEIRAKNGTPIAACGTTATERVGVAWSVFVP